MPDTPTTRLSLYKSLSDGSELVNYSQDIGQNLDLIDAAVGFQIVTSSTRPSSPYSGKAIAESDTSYRTYFSNGTSPASASWVEIPNSSGTFGGNLTISGAVTINNGLTVTGLSTLVERTTTSSNAYRARVTGDTSSRYYINADGGMNWGPGGASATDTNLYRSAANTLKTDDSLIVAGDLTVTGVGGQLIARKTADTGRTSTTLADDPHLTTTLVANAIYRIEVVLFVVTTDATNGDIQFSYTLPGATTAEWAFIGQPTSATSGTGSVVTQAFTGSTVSLGAITAADLGIYGFGVVNTDATGGTFALQWARSGTGGTVTLRSGSHLVLTRLA